MNNTFSLNRFSRLFNKHSREHLKAYLMATAVLMGVLLVILSVIAYANDGEVPVAGQHGIFGVFLLLSGSIFTSMVFAELGNQKQSIPALTLPVSHFERYLVAWIYSFIIFQLVYLGSFFLIDWLVLNIGNNNPKVHNKLMGLNFDEIEIYGPYLAFMVVQAVTFLGAIWFNKMHFIKTGFTFFVTVLLIVVANIALIHAMFDEKVNAGAPFTGIFVQERGDYTHIEPPHSVFILFLAMVAVVVLMLWTATYYKLKEKQV